MALAWVLAICSLGYLLPWAIAVSRNANNQWATGVVNLFTGWTLVGWIAALVMGCTGDNRTGRIVVVDRIDPYR